MLKGSSRLDSACHLLTSYSEHLTSLIFHSHSWSLDEHNNP
ncbi:hypothetical protein PVAP13_7KG094009 [Panicum virgatum]|uniref:Uncharacterized protein n=1 Tax=Panicum virgatum TaxID=38727 RepID=A0A8T0QDM0_PANVG|nr:hypothetical protein PVAP13_7KG094009 [Panicum virgatum]